MSRRKLIPAAQYLRMSTDHQQFSFANQKEVIRKYAARNGFAITRTYNDAGKTGVNLRQRPGLKALLRDVKSGSSNFKAILVYDVSRWGRFQDTDEPASYEFVCKQAGISLHYCAEQFVNDGTTHSSMMKILRRIMAAEYSRELSAKVYAGQRRLTQLGFKMGGTAPYGLRRLMISADRRPKRRLKPGERKAIQAYRVILAPGPESEVEWVRRIYFLAAREKKTSVQIACELDRENVRFVNGRPWTSQAVYRVLTNPVYTGCSVWGRTTQRIKQPITHLPRGQWVVTPQSYTPIVDQHTFERVQRIMPRRKTYRYKSEEELLKQLKHVLDREGRLNLHIINHARGMFRGETYSRHFGSLLEAYKRIGYRATPRAVKASEHMTQMNALRRQLLRHLLDLFPGTVRLVRDRGLVKVPPNKWVVNNAAFVPVIAPRTFDLAQTRIRREADRLWTDRDIIESLKRLLGVKGRITERLIKKTPGTPHQDTLRQRFGSCRNTWRLAGMTCLSDLCLQAKSSRRVSDSGRNSCKAS